MPQHVKIVRQGQGEVLHVLGVDLRFMCGPQDTDGAWSLMENLIPAGAGPPPHFHAWAEAYYVISGEVDFEIDGKALRVGPGDFVYAPGGTVHAFRGATDEPARMLIIDAPAHAEGFFKQVDKEVQVLARDGHKIPGIGQAHGINFLATAEAAG